MPTDTIPQRLVNQARLRPDRPAYFTREGGAWRAQSWRAYFDDVKRAGKALIALGMRPGQTVCILGFNRPEWAILDLAAMCVGGAPAGIYTTSSAEEVRYIVAHAESSLVLVENRAQWAKIDKERAGMPRLKHVVTMRVSEPIDDPLVMSWESFLERGKEVTDESFFARLDALEPGGLATLIYTSGTTGPPKAVMLSHRNLAWTALVASDLIRGGEGERTLSYLPLSHIAEQVFTLHGPVTMGSSVYFAESLAKMADNLREVQPTIFFGVPRVWEKMFAGISQKMAEAEGAKKLLLQWAREVGKSVSAIEGRGETPDLLLRAQYALAERLVYSKLKKAIGLADAKACVSGAAPIAVEVLELFHSLGIRVLEVYGQSEDTGPTSFNRPDRFRLGTVGPTLPGVSVKIADDGEILVKGPNVFLGYYKDPAATKEALTMDGWLRSGDLGTVDGQGFLHITGRKKDIIITAGGKNITPGNIEEALKQHPLIAEAVVIGDRRKFLVALITLDLEALERFASERGLSGEALHEQPAVQEELQRAVDGVNATLAKVETIKRFRVLPEPFSIEAGELTPTLKLKRRVVQERYAAEIDAMYAEQVGPGQGQAEEILR